ncbi:MAG: RsmE family RNA methyltransferase, partial [Pseudomonadota bacterium]
MLPARAPRLHVSAELPGEIPLEPRQAHYLANVMRLKPGDRFAVFNGRDGEWIASLVATDRRGGTAETGEQLRGQPESPTLTYAFAPLKKGRLDYLVEKAAEMGAGRLQPILTQHGQVHRIHREKLQRNVIEACEQCGILHVPAIEEPVALDRFLEGFGGGTLIAADESLAGEKGDPVAAIRAASPPL